MKKLVSSLLAILLCVSVVGCCEKQEEVIPTTAQIKNSTTTNTTITTTTESETTTKNETTTKSEHITNNAPKITSIYQNKTTTQTNAIESSTASLTNTTLETVVRTTTAKREDFSCIIDEPIQNINYPSCLEDLTAKSKNFDSKKEIDKYNKKFYISNDAPDFEITDYKNGVCINRYIGKSKYAEIPETIDGKPVLKLGVFMYQYEEHDFDYSIYEQYYSSPFLDADFYSYLIKNANYDEDFDYYYVSTSTGNDNYRGLHTSLSLVKKIKIPKTVECISNVDLYTVTFEVDEENPNFSTIDGSLCSKDGKELYRYNYLNETVKIPEGITTVYNGSLPSKKVYIPASVKKFYNFDTFKSCVVDKNNKVYSSSENGSLLSKNGKQLICANSKSKYKVPESVEIIKATAFASGSYKSKIIIGKNVKKIDKKIFNDLEYSSWLKIVVDKNNKWFSSKKGALYSKDGSILLYEPS